jgi:hypothetical protein
MAKSEKVQTDPNMILGGPRTEEPTVGDDEWLAANSIGEDDTQGTPSADAQDASGKEAQPAGERERDAHGRFTSKDAPDSQDTPEPKASADSVNPDDLRKAINALKRDHTPQSVIDGLDSTRIVEWGLKLANKQAESDGFGAQLSGLKAELAKLTSTDSPSAEPGLLDAKAGLAEFREMFGDDATAPLEKLLMPLLEKASTPNADPAQAARVEKMEAQLQQWEQREVRRELVDKHPEYKLGEDERWDRLLASRKGDANEYSSEREALDVHRRLLFADEINADSKAMLNEQHRLRDAGQPTPPSGATPPATLTDDQLEDLFLNAQQDGNEAEKARIEKLIKARRQTGVIPFDKLMARIGVRS